MIYFGTFPAGVFKSLDGGATWREYNVGWLNDGVFSLAFHPQDTNTVYAGTYNGVSRSLDGGLHWERWDNGWPGEQWVFSIAFDPRDPKIMYACSKNGENQGTGRDGFHGTVMKSSNGGASWLPITAGLDISNEFYKIIVDKLNPDTLYLATRWDGVFISRDGGAHWSAWNNGLTNTVAGTNGNNVTNCMVLSAGGNYLYFGCAGSGVFRRLLHRAGKAKLVSPSGTIGTATPTYTWNAEPAASWYYLWVNDSNSMPKIQVWYTAAQAGCRSGTGACSATPTIALSPGAAKWWIQTYDEYGYGPWSDGMLFTVSGGGTPAATIMSLWPVSGATAGGTAKLWAQVKNTGSVTLPSDALVWFYVEGPNWSGSHWVSSAAVSGLTAGSANWYSINWTIPVAVGTYTYWAQVWTTIAISDWSTGQRFTVTGGVLVAATLVSPSGTITTNTPTYVWKAVSNSTWYYLWVGDSAANKIQKWYTATEVGCASGTGTCSVTPSIGLAAGAAQWWIQTWNEAGYGPWSDAMSFTVAGGTIGPFVRW